MGPQLSSSGSCLWEASDPGLLESGRAITITFYFPEVGEHMPVGWRFALLHLLLLAQTSHRFAAAQESRQWGDHLPWSVCTVTQLETKPEGGQGWDGASPPPAVSPPTLAPPPSGWCCSRKSGTGELLEGHSPSLPLGHAVSHSPLPAPLPLLHSDIQSSIEKPQHPVGRTLALDSQRSGFSPDSAGDRLYYLKLVIAPLSFSVLICKRAVMNSIYVRVTGAHACDFISTEPRTL